MREYGQIQCSFWEQASEDGWSSDAMLLAAYLLTGPKSNGIGCYRLTDGTVTDDLNWERERVTETLSELFRKGFANRYGTVVFIPKFLRWNPISNGNVAKAREQEFEAIPSDEAKAAAALALLRFGKHWSKGFTDRLETLSKGFAKGYGKQNPTQPNPEPDPEPTRKEPPQSPAAAGSSLPPADDVVDAEWNFTELSDPGSAEAVPDPTADLLPAEDQPPPPPQRAAGKKPPPIPFVVSPSVAAWAKQQGYSVAEIEASRCHFENYLRSKGGKPYSDYDAAFRNCVSADWGGVIGKLRRASPAGGPTLNRQEALEQRNRAVAEAWAPGGSKDA